MEIKKARQKVQEAQEHYDKVHDIYLTTYGRGKQRRENEDTWALNALNRAKAELYQLEHPDPQLTLVL